VIEAIDAAETVDPATGLRQRHAHVPATPLLCATRQRHHRAERRQIAGRMVERLCWQRLGAVDAGGLTALPGNAADGLHQAVEPAPVAPRSLATVGAERDAEDTGPQFGESLWREAAACDRTGAITLNEHIRLADERRQPIPAFRPAEIDERRALAPAAVDDERRHVGQMRSGDPHHLRTMLGQVSAANRPGDDASEVEHAHVRERAVARPEPLRRSIADALDLEQWKPGDRLSLGVRLPFRRAPEHPGTKPGRSERVFDLLAAP